MDKETYRSLIERVRRIRGFGGDKSQPVLECQVCSNPFAPEHTVVLMIEAKDEQLPFFYRAFVCTCLACFSEVFEGYTILETHDGVSSKVLEKGDKDKDQIFLFYNPIYLDFYVASHRIDCVSTEQMMVLKAWYEVNSVRNPKKV